ncbi:MULTISPECIES: hypothetical protein [unclassified Streptomyces]|uniref:hypothetical protein n=1 Tax=Streptomyces sp. SID4948 TaxID=2690287 RepID=UPI001F1E5343|nr:MULTISPECIES: hypothetical protein [unclassified Streptomyces]
MTSRVVPMRLPAWPRIIRCWRTREFSMSVAMLTTPIGLPSAPSSRKYEADSRRSSSSPGMRQVYSRSMTGSPVSSTCRIATTTDLPMSPGCTSVIRRPSRRRRSTPSCRSAASLSHTQRRSVSQMDSPTGERARGPTAADGRAGRQDSAPVGSVTVTNQSPRPRPASGDASTVIRTAEPPLVRSRIAPDHGSRARTRAAQAASSTDVSASSRAAGRPTTSSAR